MIISMTSFKVVYELFKKNGCHLEGSTSAEVSIEARPADAPLQIIGPGQVLTVTCGAGHRWTTNMHDIEYKCKLCKMLDLINHDHKVVAVSTEYTSAQAQFEFQCERGYRFMSTLHMAAKGCLSCNLLKQVNNKHGSNSITMDKKCLYAHDKSKLRFHCSKVIHDRLCANPYCRKIRERRITSQHKYDPECQNFVCCDTDFYAIPYFLKRDNTFYGCCMRHVRLANWEVINCLRIFETLFDERFDDPMAHLGVEFTGYNESIGIAFIHMNDNVPAMCVDSASAVCEANSIELIVVPREVKKVLILCRWIVDELGRRGHYSAPSEEIFTLLRARMRQLMASDTIFLNRI